MSGPCDLCATHHASHIYNANEGDGDEDLCQCCWNTALSDNIERTEHDPDCDKPCTYCERNAS